MDLYNLLFNCSCYACRLIVGNNRYPEFVKVSVASLNADDLDVANQTAIEPLNYSSGDCFCRPTNDSGLLKFIKCELYGVSSKYYRRNLHWNLIINIQSFSYPIHPAYHYRAA